MGGVELEANSGLTQDMMTSIQARSNLTVNLSQPIQTQPDLQFCELGLVQVARVSLGWVGLIYISKV